MEREELGREIENGYAAYSAGDFEAATRLFDQDFELIRPGGMGVIRGLQALREFYEPDALRDMSFEIRSIEISDDGDTALVESVVRATGSQSGLALTQEGFQVWTLREGRFVRCAAFIDRDEACEAAGFDPAG